ncbi:MAG: polyprenyl diphosphate synthase [Brachymonas sp.]|nr:polyprenyl diphosphate synthase [Brachymonas sp.]
MFHSTRASAPAAVPQHVAIVMDGNGRWAKKRFMPRLAGHREGLEALKRCVQACVQRGIRVLTVFAFSSENWNRPADEVSGLMDLLLKAVSKEVPKLHEQGIQLHFAGERSALSPAMRHALAEAEKTTAKNQRLILNVCVNYGGRWDVAQAAAKLARQGQAITEESLQQALALSHVSDPDLLIRTGGEKRISNFLLWQSAYSELYFTDTLWPEFDEQALDAALRDFQSRERRFGQTSEQVSQQTQLQEQPARADSGQKGPAC